MKNIKGFTLVEVVISWVIITIIILNAATFFLFAWKLKVRFEEDRAVLGILTSYIEAKKATCLGTAINRYYTTSDGSTEGIYGAIQFKSNKGEFENWKKYCIDMWDFTKDEKKLPYPPLVYPLPSTQKFEDDGKQPNDKYVKIEYQLCQIEIERKNFPSSYKPKYFLMPSVYVWCKSPNSNKRIGMQVTNAFPWRNYNNGQFDNF